MEIETMPHIIAEYTEEIGLDRMELAVTSFLSDENISVSVETCEMHAESYMK
jgi:5-carboxymethyl-2-hydroxymuconate isomerase